MRILLVKPQAHLKTVLGLQRFQCLEPLEFGYLAAAIPGRHELRVFDLRLYRLADATFERALARFRPDLVGFTAYSHESGTMKRLAGTVRRLLPKTRIVVGGHHATVAPTDCNIPDIDYIVRGEGCAPFGALVTALDKGDEPEGIANLLFTGDRFDETAASVWPRYPDPRTLPIPRRDLWDSRPYSCIWVHENPRDWQVLFPQVAMARTSYGCKMTCSFCIVPFLSGTTHMPRLVDVVAEDIARIEVDHVYFADDENFIDEQFGFELAEALEKRGVKKRYFAWARATTILRYPELLRRWKEIGLDGVFVGFEFVYQPGTESDSQGRHGGPQRARPRHLAPTGYCLPRRVHGASGVRPRRVSAPARLCERHAPGAIQFHRLHALARHAGLRNGAARVLVRRRLRFA